MSLHYEIETEQQPVELYKLLKLANVVAGGGEAKVVISQGYVLLNGDVEIQKRKKIYSGDVIEFNGDIIELICHNEPIEPVKKIKAPTTATNLNDNKQNSSVKNKTKRASSKKPQKNKQPNHNSSEHKKPIGKRRSINF